jgi:hypothetical protein
VHVDEAARRAARGVVGETQPERYGDRTRDLILNGEHIAQLAIVFAGPRVTGLKP